MTRPNNKMSLGWHFSIFKKLEGFEIITLIIIIIDCSMENHISTFQPFIKNKLKFDFLFYSRRTHSVPFTKPRIKSHQIIYVKLETNEIFRHISNQSLMVILENWWNSWIFMFISRLE